MHNRDQIHAQSQIHIIIRGMSSLLFRFISSKVEGVEKKLGAYAGLSFQFIQTLCSSIVVLSVKLLPVPTFQMIHGRFLVQILGTLILLNQSNEQPYAHKKSVKTENLLYGRGLLASFSILLFYTGVKLLSLSLGGYVFAIHQSNLECNWCVLHLG